MLLSDKGHVKLTDFGLSRVHHGRGNDLQRALQFHLITTVFTSDLNISDLLSPSVNKNDYHLVRTPGQVLSLTSRLSFKDGMSPCSDRAQSPLLSTPEIMRDHRAYKENSYCIDLNSDVSIGVSPPRSGDSFAAIKRKFYNDQEEDANFKLPRTGLSEIFHFASLNDDSDLR